ncbi:MAG: hypothetical protein STSR0008_24060 [Ignavibacterium sp.]
MIKKLLYVMLIVLTIIFMSCSSIEYYRNLDQQVNQPLTTSIGGTIFRLNRSSDLPNALGKADLFGGKVDRGYTYLKFLGFTEKGELILLVYDINKSSTETTMGRYKDTPIQVQTNVDILSSSPEEGTKFVFDYNKQKELVISGIQVIFKDIQPYSVTYILKDIQPK